MAKIHETMTVGELIEVLSELPEDTEINDGEGVEVCLKKIGKRQMVAISNIFKESLNEEEWPSQEDEDYRDEEE